MIACTVVARNYLPYARVLARSYSAANDGARLVALVLDGIDAGRDDEPFEVLAPEELPLDPDVLAEMDSLYDVKELATALKPTLLSALLDRDAAAGAVLYLDPDILVAAELSQAGELARTHGVVLVPHALSPYPHDLRTPTEVHVRRTGIFNGGCVAVGERGRDFLAWWGERLRRDAVFDAHEGLFVDQRWLDFVPAYFDHSILRDPGWDVAYWNLHERRLTRSGDEYLVNGHPLRCFHFSGFDPTVPGRLTRRADRFAPLRDETVAALATAYAEALFAAGWEEAAPIPYGRAGGVSTTLDRRLRREALRATDRLERNASLLGGMDERIVSGAARARALLAAGPEPSQPPGRRGRFLRPVRTAVSRLLRPVDEHARRIDVALVDAVLELEARVARLERSNAEERASDPAPREERGRGDAPA